MEKLMNYTKNLQDKVRKLSREQLENLAVSAIFHLRCVSGSRNSFQAEWLQGVHDAKLSFPQRDPAIEAMHQHAVDFLSREDN